MAAVRLMLELDKYSKYSNSVVLYYLNRANENMKRIFNVNSFLNKYV